MAIFGNNLGTSDAWATAENNMIGSLYTMGPINGVADSLTCYLQATIANKKMKTAIYNSLKVLVGVSDEVTVTANALHWEIFTFSAPKPQLTANADYYLVLFSESLGGIGNARSSAVVGKAVLDEFKVYDGFTDPWVTVLDGADEWMLIYCTYTLSPANPLIGKPFISPDLLKKAKIR